MFGLMVHWVRPSLLFWLVIELSFLLINTGVLMYKKLPTNKFGIF
jgi:cytochrome b subunit of formate dehydrogenase